MNGQWLSTDFRRRTRTVGTTPLDHLAAWVLIGSLVLVGNLAGCAYERAAIAGRAKQDLVGLAKKDLYLCAGAPHRVAAIEDIEIIEYESTGTYSTDEGGSYSRDCTVSFVVQDGTVQSVKYSGSTGGLLTKGHQCAYIVRDCLSMMTVKPRRQERSPRSGLTRAGVHRSTPMSLPSGGCCENSNTP